MSGSSIDTLNCSLILSALVNNGHIKKEKMIGGLSQIFKASSSVKRALSGGYAQPLFGFLATEVVVMVYTERPKGLHVIPLRKAEKHETRYYRQVAKENLS